MLAPLSWLKEYVDIDVTPEELEKKLFDSGFEVEQVIKYGDKLDKVVTCKIESIAQHPNADRLRICQVDAGKYGKLQIITNAVNVKVGDIVPLAVDGATLANGEGIKAGKVRGEDSFGMFCGGEELGIDENFYPGASGDSVLIFQDEFPLGEEVRDLLGIRDYVFDISVLANRPDCQSVLGISREIACFLGKKVKEPSYDFKVTASGDKNITVTVNDKDLCPRYIAHLVKNVKIAPSPKWMSRRLALCGINSINNIVDITNYVLLELGQPMHAFDLNNVGGRKIIVRRATDGEKITTLDEKEFTLKTENLVICDAEKPVALAGIMGGLNSGIGEGTNEVLFEAAKFKRDNIRKSSRTLGQSSDSSKRFEKGVDEYTVENAMKRALSLICELRAGDVTEKRIDESAHKEQENKSVTTTFSAINGVLGIKVPNDTIVDILKRLEFKVETDGKNITTIAPPYREDVEGYPDLAEEVIRIYGYEHIVPTLLKNATITAGGFSKEQNDEMRVKRALGLQGYSEVMTFSFYSKKDLQALKLRDGDEEGKVIIIENPISDNYEVMRRTMIPSLLGVVSRNIKKGNDRVKVFELANTYTYKSLPVDDFPIETKKLCMALYGKGEDFFSLKGAVETLEDYFGLEFDLNTRASKTYLHPGRSAVIKLNGEEIGVFGQVAYPTAKEYDITEPVYVAEISYEELKKGFATSFKYSPLPEFPDIDRDLALVCDEKVTNGEIVDVIKSAAKQNIKEVKLFDIYTGEQIGEGKKSMAYTITFTSKDKELTNDMVDGFVKKILGALKFRLGIVIR